MTHPGGLVGGRYRLAERIGAGAMGIVWRARDERLNRLVALKQLVLPPTLSAAERHEAGERIMREGRLAARLHHPNAIAVFDVADHDGAPWLVMEYLASRSLAAVLTDRGPLPPHEVAAIGRQLADALAAAHAAGIVHRDIKPGNVLLGEEHGRPSVTKLTDFGISRAADDVTVTRTGVLSGTPAYLAPEVARGAEPSVSSDVFALGATLYSAVEGRPPFGQGDNALALLHVVARGQVTPPRRAGPLTALLMHLLRAEPGERPTMTQASAALARVAAGGSYAPAGSYPAAPAGHPAAGHPAVGHTRMDLPPVGVAGFGGPGGPGGPGGHGRGGSSSSSDENQRRPALLVAVGVALAVLAGLFALAATTGDDGKKAALTPASSAEQTSAPPATTTTPTTTTPRPVTPAELQQAVAGYYALLPRDPERAWELLGPSSKAIGFDAYEEAWEDIEAVQAVPTEVDAAAMTVTVLVVYREDDRRPRAEMRQLVLVRGEGEQLLIEQDKRVGGAQVPTTTRKRRG